MIDLSAKRTLDWWKEYLTDRISRGYGNNKMAKELKTTENTISVKRRALGMSGEDGRHCKGDSETIITVFRSTYKDRIETVWIYANGKMAITKKRILPDEVKDFQRSAVDYCKYNNGYSLEEVWRSWDIDAEYECKAHSYGARTCVYDKKKGEKHGVSAGV